MHKLIGEIPQIKLIPTKRGSFNDFVGRDFACQKIFSGTQRVLFTLPETN